MITIHNLEELESTFKNYRYFNILSTLWNIYSKIIDVDSKTKLSNQEFIDEPIWYSFYKLYILNRSVKIEVNKLFLQQLREYIVIIVEKYTKISLDNITVSFYNTTATLNKTIDSEALSKILIINESRD